MRIAKAIAAAVGVYLAVYGVLSASGGYSERLYVGSHRYRFGLGIPTAQLWEPLCVKNTPWERNVPGWFFAPCVWVDRRVWHRDIDIMELFRKNPDAAGADGTRNAEGVQPCALPSSSPCSSLARWRGRMPHRPA